MAGGGGPSQQRAAQDAVARPAAFFACLNGACGLRFPVAPGDHFDECCPRCGGSVAEVSRAEPRGVPRVARARLPKVHLLLDNWRSLFNVGSILRTADGAGVDHMHLCGITPTPEHRKLRKTALGAEETVSWSYAPDAVAVGAGLQRQGMALWVLEGGPESRPLWECLLPVSRPVVLAAGNEVVGVDPGLVALADEVMHIPMVGHKESLNVAIAFSVAVYWLIGQAHAEIDA